jgi:hypothetical protein
VLTPEGLLNINLPALNYDNCDLVKEEKSNFAHHNKTWACNVIEWKGFGQAVIEWRRGFYRTNHTALYAIPDLVSSVRVANDNESLHFPVLYNVLDNVAKVMTHCEFVGEGGVRSAMAASMITATAASLTTATSTSAAPINAGLWNADAYCMVGDDPSQIIFPVEVRGRWTFGNALWDPTLCTSNQISATTELYNYMVVAESRYGIITSYDVWWFAYRTADGDFYISAAYLNNSTDPSIMECVAYLCSKGRVQCNRPPSAKTDMVLQSVNGICSGDFEDENKKPNSKRWKDGNKDDDNGSTNELNNQIGDTFQLNSLLGEGRCPVYAELT